MEYQKIDELDSALLKARALLKDRDSYCKVCKQQVAHLDEETQDLLHYLENEKLSAPKMAKLVAALRVIRIERRKYKICYQALERLTTKSNSKKIDAINAVIGYKEADTYKVRTNILKEVFGDERTEIHF